jgi:hypothetical protein
VAPQFQRDPSVSFEEVALSPTYDFLSPIDRWNRMNQRWLQMMPPQRTTMVRHEDQLVDQRRVLEQVEQTLKLSRRNPELETISAKVDVGAHVSGEYDADYYRDRQYMLDYPTSLLAQVNAALDPMLMARFDYRQELWTLADREVHGIQIIVRPCTSDAGDAREITFDPIISKRSARGPG